jgi:quinoprotein glucose dehydrogenase
MEKTAALAGEVKPKALWRRLPRIFYGLCLLAVGVALTTGGTYLLYLGGSFYYAIAGLLTAVSGIAVMRARWDTGAVVYLAMMLGSLAWGLWEAGLNGWALAPRVLSPAVFGLPFLIVALVSGGKTNRLLAGLSVVTGIVVTVASANAAAYQPAPAFASRPPALSISLEDGDYPMFSGKLGGGHFSRLSQINISNANKLKVVWTTLVGPLSTQAYGLTQSVPLKIGDSLYVCTPFNDVAALDPLTGKIRWRFDAKSNSTGLMVSRCRGVGYYAVPGAAGLCATRIITATMDARVIAIDAKTGVACPGFGRNGIVDLNRGLTMRGPGYYAVSSAPLIFRDKIIVGGFVADNQYVGEPSGVIRAYGAATGKLAWAWDLGKPGKHGEPKPGEFYTPGTPNSWGPMSADDALGLVYVPMGNATPDFWGGHRSAESDRYASAIVALDIETGEPRWSYQMTHHDLWDYDGSAQPALYDMPTAKGTIPVVVESGKRGQTFILDRRTGEPVFPVKERPAPQRGAAERLSPTQPWSVRFPDLAGPKLTERSMWGITALDQLWCRIKFRKARYEGPLTPPGLAPSVMYPGNTGGVNWASASIDPRRHLAFFAANHLANYIRLIPREEANRLGLKANPAEKLGESGAQEGAPYAVDTRFFMSPLNVPCQEPPFGTIHAVDLVTGRLVWSRQLGLARDTGPFGMHSHLPFMIGTPTYGGPMSTAGGVMFVAATQDHAFRAFDSETGRLLFTGDLPDSAATTPMTYLDRSGRQIVAITSNATKGGATYTAITAFALR